MIGQEITIMVKRTVFQFKITLKNVKPIVWRRIQISSLCTFWDLHVAIQDAMGWTDSHLHQFEAINHKTIQKECIGIPDGDDFETILPGWEIKVRDYIKLKNNQKMNYIYDFGDDWEHTIEFEGEQEKQFETYPICIAGKSACPPEDVGGAGGYDDFIAAIKDPYHEEHNQLLEWVGGSFDPKIFDPKLVKFDNPKMRYQVAFVEDVKFQRGNKMSAKQFKSKWKVISTDQWDVEPDWHIEFDGKSSGSFQFGYMQASIDYKSDGDDRVEFTFHGNDECDEMFGRGWAEINGADLQGYLHFHNGDDTDFTAKKVKAKVKL